MLSIPSTSIRLREQGHEVNEIAAESAAAEQPIAYSSHSIAISAASCCSTASRTRVWPTSACGAETLHQAFRDVWPAVERAVPEHYVTVRNDRMVVRSLPLSE